MMNRLPLRLQEIKEEEVGSGGVKQLFDFVARSTDPELHSSHSQTNVRL